MSVVSVLIPSFQCAKRLSYAIESCIVQFEFIKEVIIVDDFSTDASWELMQRYAKMYPEKIFCYRNIQKGGNNARNYCFSLSTGHFIQWLDADDEIKPEKLKCQIKAFQKFPAIDIVYSDWEIATFNDDFTVVKSEFIKKKKYKDFVYQLLVNNWSPPHNYLLKRNIAETLNGIKAWHPNRGIAQDREYFTLAAIIGAKFCYVEGSFSIYNRWNINSVSSNIKKNKFKNIDAILHRFECVMRNDSNLSEMQIIKYQHIINTELLLLRVFGFPSVIRYGKPTMINSKWGIIHGVRTKLKYLLALYKNSKVKI